MQGNVNLSPEAQQVLAQLQTLQQQLQIILYQKDGLSLQKTETEKAIEELEKNESNEVFKIAGPIMIKIEREKLLSELKAELEKINLQLKALEKQEEKFRKKLEEKQEKLRAILEGVHPSSKAE